MNLENMRMTERIAGTLHSMRPILGNNHRRNLAEEVGNRSKKARLKHLGSLHHFFPVCCLSSPHFFLNVFMNMDDNRNK